jgi:hypothetical protein
VLLKPHLIIADFFSAPPFSGYRIMKNYMASTNAYILGASHFEIPISL